MEEQWILKNHELTPAVSTMCQNIEGWGPFSTVRDPDFTPCFEDAVIRLIPSFFILIVGSMRLYILLKRKKLPEGKTRNWIYYMKMILLYVLLSVKVKNIVFSIGQASVIFQNIQLISQFINIFVLVFVINLHHVEYTRNTIASGVLLFYWLLEIPLSFIKLRTLYIMYHTTDQIQSNQLYRYTACVGLSIAIFWLEIAYKPKCQSILLSEEDELDCPEEKTNIFGRLVFSWVTPLMKLGYRSPLEMDDMWNLKHSHRAENIRNDFRVHWEVELKKKKPSLFIALAKLLKEKAIIGAVFRLAQDLSQYTQPMLLKLLMKWVSSHLTDKPEPNYVGVFIAIGMLFSSASQAVLINQYFQNCSEACVLMQSALTTAIYQKSIVLSNASRQESTLGEIVNRMSVDAQRLKDFCTYYQIIWSGPFKILLALYLLWQLMGPSIWAGVAVLLLVIPINITMAKTMRRYQNIQMRNKDTRVKIMNEILNGIKVIKLYAWEIPFINKINYIRNDQELVMLKKIGFLAAGQTFTLTSTPFFVSIVTFAVYSLISTTPLTSDVAFVAISLFSLLQFPMDMFPNVISASIEAYVSLQRIEEFLLSEEVNPDAIKREHFKTMTNWNPSVPLVEMNSVNVRWDSYSPDVLTDINLEVKKGDLTAIVGRVGSGKSTLIGAILGDNNSSGEVVVRGTVAYVPQQPWIMNATVRENILFGLKYDSEFYETVLEACSLELDMKMLSDGDQTEIGERGINLSGGQKARISLARALYARADIYLFDDPLSAVDAHVGRHLFDNVLGPKGLLKTKARILVTHAISFLSQTTEVVILKEGKISSKGTFDSLMAEEGDLYKLVNDFTNQKPDSFQVKTDDNLVLEEFQVLEDEVFVGGESYEENSAIAPKIPRRRFTERRFSTDTAASRLTFRRASIESAIFKNHRQKKKVAGAHGQLMTVEEGAKGKVSKSVYKQYAMACSFGGVVAILFLQFCSQSAQVGSNMWVKYWSNLNVESGPTHGVWFYLSIYALIGCTSTLIAYLQTLIMWVYCAIRSATVFHSNMLHTVLKSPMSFFDTTPLGRILNRFSKDQHTVDEILPKAFQVFIRAIFSGLAIVGVISFSTPIFLAMVIPLAIVYYFTQKYYITSSREMKRLDSIARSPIYSHFQETVQGVSTIRAYKQERVFIHKNQLKLDDNIRAYFPSITCNRWLSVRLDIISALVIFGASLFAVFNVILGKNYDSGLVGLSVSYALGIAPALNQLVRSYGEIETNIISVERIKEYVDLPREKYESDTHVDPMWPSQGHIEFKHYSTRYRAGLDLCLRDLSFTVKPKEKVGIVGRTGAGKSSLSLALLRIIEGAGGSIVVDGVDISTLKLFDLRSRVTIIPQDPVLFAGSVRENLDPFGAHRDDEVWKALEDSHLKEYVSSMEGKLNGVVLEGGDNFSVGQRQLICLARALLRRTTILILDEATAAIDVETDSIIQETIRKQFKDCTILTIAHRINTVMDSDKILVLDKGTVKEFDSPENLLSDQSTVFYSLSKEAGLIE